MNTQIIIMFILEDHSLNYFTHDTGQDIVSGFKTIVAEE